MRGFLIHTGKPTIAIVIENDVEFSAISAALADRAMRTVDAIEAKICQRLHDELNKAWLAAQ